MKIQAKILYSALSLSCALLFCGCNTVIFPSTSNSNDRAGEYVVIKMLNFKDMQEYKYEYKTVFGTELKEINVLDFGTGGGNKALGSEFAAEAGAMLLASILDFTIEETQKALRQEAELHVANYGNMIAKDNFWTYYNKKDNDKNKLIPTYYGFEVIRYTKEHNYNEGKFSSKFVFGLYPSQGDAAMFLVAPLYIEIASVKAKTSDWKWFSFFPLFWHQFLLANYTQDVNINAKITVTSTSVNKDREFKEQKLLDATINLPPVNLRCIDKKGRVIMLPFTPPKPTDQKTSQNDKTPDKKCKTFETRLGELKDYKVIKMPPQTSCWWMSPAISKHEVEGKTFYSSGTFCLKAVIEEEDASECKNYIEKAASEIETNKDKIKEQVINIYNETVKKD